MGTEPPKPRRRPRADSLRNRELLLDAARAVFSAGGPDASLEAVARKAGVGIGTVYRHFPTREALFQAVYKREVDEMETLARTLSNDPDPVLALRKWMHASIGMVATKRGMLAALSPVLDSSSEFFAGTTASLMRAISGLMESGIAAGRLRDDITPDELMRAFLGICYMREQPGWQETVVRVLDVFIDGLANVEPAPER
ncbi:transcriptional regulator [Salipiger aestuarii]|uniref:TetR family transcriptional regulator n=1 Tax=Salipiger aestuarii TaxID=568098 RepID=A0A327XUH3_9RHOB|nr:TetR/AcrR family transcriptional regulator [Salipiger aestuarii]EIE51268.1 TetR family transcriptional regulator [Citreicella sp. 357]KAA8605351.1 transcriptional regulator [Salipiger aestuarii]KAA8607769.1 transcriptional regulator [Salipiger aestuarii]KAB2538808.1 transcriptional regulator [Salipiger aestuarii]RAK12354.1 TetR family transcriptional regulator [Salipiger aestuarii]